MTKPIAHGTKIIDGKIHAVLDIDLWKCKFPLKSETEWYASCCLDCPKEIAYIEQSRIEIPTKTDLGEKNVETDIFVWATGNELGENPITKIGGIPWRQSTTPWPTDQDGVPLQFIAQINFTDSKDLIPFDLPGDVLLLFARWEGGYVNWDMDNIHIEWSTLDALNPMAYHDVPTNGRLSFCHTGVIHRIDQYWDEDDEDSTHRFQANDTECSDIQATSIGTHAQIPQGWPFEKGDGNTLICMFSSYMFRGLWPLCDIEMAPEPLRADGSNKQFHDYSALSANYADAGAIWVYRDRDGNIKHEMAC